MKATRHLQKKFNSIFIILINFVKKKTHFIMMIFRLSIQKIGHNYSPTKKKYFFRNISRANEIYLI